MHSGDSSTAASSLVHSNEVASHALDISSNDNALATLSWPGWDGLDGIAEETLSRLRESFQQAAPFPHLILDDFFPADILDPIEAEFDYVGGGGWYAHNHALQRKRVTPTNTLLPPATQNYMNHIYSGPFLRFVSAITGIRGLVTDPSLVGGGMHQIPQGGSFEVHTDFRLHPVTRLTNRLIIITYLGRDWQEEHGGALELWQRTPAAKVANILPRFGRTILMDTAPDNRHGQPVPVSTPDGRPRRSVAAYYYSSGRENAGPPPRLDTRYIIRPDAGIVLRTMVMAQRLIPARALSAIRGLLGR